MTSPHFYLIKIRQDLEIELIGPFDTEDARDQSAREHRADDPGKENGLFKLKIECGQLPIWATAEDFCGDELGDDDV